MKGSDIHRALERSFEALRDRGFDIDQVTGRIRGFNANVLANYICERLDLLVTAHRRFYEYEDGVWRRLDPPLLERFIRDAMHEARPNIWKLSYERDTLAALEREVEYAPEMDPNRDYVNVLNGMYHVPTGELKEHSPGLHSSIQIPLEYDPRAQCPRFEQFLDEVFQGDEYLIDLVQEMIGYCLTADTGAQKAFVFSGGGSNGKSVLSGVIADLCGEGNYSTVSLTEFGNRFARSELVGKTANISTENEVDEKGLQTSWLKAIVAADPISMEEKFMPAFTYRPFAKLIFSVNSLPHTRDRTHGFFRRLVIIPFLRRFSEEERDPGLADKLRAELSGIFNFAMEGYRRLRANNYVFTEASQVRSAVQAYQEEQNPMLIFFDQFITSSHSLARVPRSKLLRGFRKWCNENGDPTAAKMSSQAFWSTFRSIAAHREIDIQDFTSNGKRYICGIEFTYDDDGSQIIDSSLFFGTEDNDADEGLLDRLAAEEIDYEVINDGMVMIHRIGNGESERYPIEMVIGEIEDRLFEEETAQEFLGEALAGL